MTPGFSRVFVTGGSGFIGTNLVQELLRRRITTRSFDCKPPLDANHEFVHTPGDVLDRAAICRAISDFQPDFVVHLAARCDLRGQSIDEYPENTRGVLNVIEALKESTSLRRVIFASSRYVHVNEVQPVRDDEYSPFTAYGASKAEGERIVRQNLTRVPWVIVRPTSIWGPWFDVPYKGFFHAVRRGVYLHPKSERIFKSYGYVGNVVHQLLTFLQAEERAVQGRVFYTADYIPIEMRDMAERIRRQFDAPPIRQTPLFMLKGLARAGDLLRRFGVYNPPLSSFRLKNLRTQMVYDLSATAEIVGPSPFGLDAGIAKTVEWMKVHG